MNDPNTYQAVRINDIAEWRLLCSISETGIEAYLKNSNPTEDIRTLFEEKWQPDSDVLLEKIENAVYDHPQVLDDFSADIVVVAPKAIWVPTEFVDDDEDNALYLYNQVYTADEEDVMMESVDDATCLYSLVTGLNAFLQRTFPGSRVHSHLAVMVNRFRERSSDVPRIFVEIRNRQVDIMAFERRNLLMAATHNWNEISDIQYHIFNIMNVYGLDPREVQISLSGLRDEKNELMRELRKSVNYVMLTMLPSISSKAGMTTPLALLLRS